MSARSARLRPCLHWAGAAFAVFCLFLAGVPVVRAVDTMPDAARGLEIAMKTCAGCHLIGDGKATTAAAGIPSFRTIANRKDQSAQRIISALLVPHPPMPDTHLTRAEVMHIIAYLDTLREKGSGKPSLLPGKNDKKFPLKGRSPS